MAHEGALSPQTLKHTPMHEGVGGTKVSASLIYPGRHSSNEGQHYCEMTCTGILDITHMTHCCPFITHGILEKVIPSTYSKCDLARLDAQKVQELGTVRLCFESVLSAFSEVIGCSTTTGCKGSVSR